MVQVYTRWTIGDDPPPPHGMRESRWRDPPMDGTIAPQKATMRHETQKRLGRSRTRRLGRPVGGHNTFSCRTIDPTLSIPPLLRSGSTTAMTVKYGIATQFGSLPSSTALPKPLAAETLESSAW